jgi:hypothetical protein
LQRFYFFLVRQLFCEADSTAQISKTTLWTTPKINEKPDTFFIKVLFFMSHTVDCCGSQHAVPHAQGLHTRPWTLILCHSTRYPRVASSRRYTIHIPTKSSSWLPALGPGTYHRMRPHAPLCMQENYKTDIFDLLSPLPQQLRRTMGTKQY